jgi:hypothetical protein
MFLSEHGVGVVVDIALLLPLCVGVVVLLVVLLLLDFLLGLVLSNEAIRDDAFGDRLLERSRFRRWIAVL